MNNGSKGALCGIWKETIEHEADDHNPIAKLRRAPQPPLSYPGATPDSDRAKKPASRSPPPMTRN